MRASFLKPCKSRNSEHPRVFCSSESFFARLGDKNYGFKTGVFNYASSNSWQLKMASGLTCAHFPRIYRSPRDYLVDKVYLKFISTINNLGSH